MVSFGPSGCIWANLVVFWQIGCIRAKWLYSGNNVVFRQNCCIWTKGLHLGKSGYIRANWLHLGEIGCIRANWWCLVKVVVFGKGCCIWAKVVVLRQVRGSWAEVAIIGQNCSFGQNSFIRAKWLYLGKVVVFWQIGCIWSKWLYCGKDDVFGQKWLY